MGKIDGAVAWAVAIANNPSHGYDQQNRWGPDYDCSSLIIAAWEEAGVPVKTRGATYTGNMRSVFLSAGFEDITARVDRETGSGLQPGDVLLNYSAHTAMVVQEGQIVEASLNEFGRTTGGATGDQGREIRISRYYNYPWNCVLRFKEPQAPAEVGKADKVLELPTISRGSKGWFVCSMQGALIAHGYSCGPDGPDGDFGYNTWNAVCRFQSDRKLLVDGIIGQKTGTALLLGKS